MPRRPDRWRRWPSHRGHGPSEPSMNKKPKKREEGAPLWVLTYGDLMSLLLVFFVLIVSMSKIKEDEQQRFLEEVIEAFGAKGGGGRMPTDMDPTMSEITRQVELQIRTHREVNQSNATDPGMQGREEAVRM